MSQKMASVNGLHLYCESFGIPKHPAVLLIMGNSAQAIMWPTEFCENLAKCGFFVIRYDNRDTGLSTCIDYALNPYTLHDLANDAVGLLDALKIKKAHIVGLSMGASIGQLLALYHPQHCQTLVCMMATADLSIKNDAFAGKKIPSTSLPPPARDYILAVLALNTRTTNSRQEKIQQLVENWQLANGKKAKFDKDYWQALMTLAVRREESNEAAQGGLKFAHFGNHTQAQKASPEPNIPMLKGITLPTLVIQGSEDPLFPPPHGQALADAIPNATLLQIEGMGHALNIEYFQDMTQALVGHFQQDTAHKD